MKLRFILSIGPPVEAEGTISECASFLREVLGTAQPPAQEEPAASPAPPVARPKPQPAKHRASGGVPCPKCYRKTKPKGLSIHLSRAHGQLGRTNKSNSTRSDTVEVTRSPAESGDGGSSPPTAGHRVEKPSPLEAPGVTLWLRRKGPPFGHSVTQLHGMFPKVEGSLLRHRCEEFRRVIKKERGGSWSEVNGVWAWAAPLVPLGSGTEPSAATSTE